MRIFKTRSVVRFAKAERVADATLVEAIGQAERGLIDADLGGGLIKLRVARPGEGKRGGYRLLIGFRAGDRALFMFGYAKKDLGNITDKVEQGFRLAGQDFLAASIADIERQLEAGTIVEVSYDQEA